ncbi:MAG: hypothetical protein ACKOPO_11585 [Novosphingobium sp.]
MAKQYSLQLLGPFRLSCAGERIDLRGRRAQALIAMLATSESHERTRAWLQDRLWGSRPGVQAQNSLRRELSSLRKMVNRADGELLCADGLRVWLNSQLLHIQGQGSGEFLEGMDLPGEDGFEDWLRGQRARAESAPARPAPPPAASGRNVRAAAHPARALSSIALATIDGADELRDALAERLSRIRWLELYFAGQGTGEARFALSGRIDKGGKVALKLVDQDSGRMLWTGRYAVDAADDAAPGWVDEAISAVRARIAQAEQARAIAAPDDDDLASLVWQSQWHMHRLSKDDAAEAARLAARAVAVDAIGAEAIAQATWVRVWDLWVTRAREPAIRAMREQAQRAIIADHEDARGHMLAGIAEIWLMQPLRAEALLRRAVELDPSLIMARVQLACALYHRLMLAEAEAELLTALRLSPNDQYLFFIAGELATTCLMQDKFDAALVHAETSLAARRSYVHGHVAKVNALVRLGRMDEARAAHAELYRANPGYSPQFIDWIPFLDSSWNAWFKDGLNRAATGSD